MRRAFFEVEKETGSDIAREAADRIGALYDIEAQINGRSADERHAVRQEHSRPKVKAFKVWAEENLDYISGKSDLAKAFRYVLNRRDAFGLFLEDGRVAIDTDVVEQPLSHPPCGLGGLSFHAPTICA
ncbi:transposase [Rhodobacter sphaeroides]|uniref:IS66 family transposase n=1 Tax=Cereibacter sphaeroides TaxID=1063 RepID=UPI0013260E69|nr:transposase [Cereibacter sphaeroides]